MSNSPRRHGHRTYQVLPVGVALVCASFAYTPSVHAEPADQKNDQSEVTVQVDAPAYDGLQALLDDEASTALAAGDFKRAWHFFWRLLEIDPHDVHALRESGRIANALGKFTYAVDALGEVDSLDGTTPDPEIHYLRGESLYALGRKKEAETEFQLTARDLGKGPYDRRGTLWLARIEVYRGNLDGALALYQPLLDNDMAGTPTYAEVTLYEVEAYILCHDWKSAETMLRSFLKQDPKNERARSMLAWVLEGRDKIDEELPLRQEFADDWTEHPRKTLEYARALERAHDDSAALARYREARSLGVVEASSSVSRLEQRLSPEVGGGMVARGDTSGSIDGWFAAATVPFGGRFRVALSALHETSSGAIFGSDDRSETAATGWAVLTGRRGGIVALGSTVRTSDPAHGIGGSAIGQTSPLSDVQLQARADVNVPWHESASTFREDGEMDALGATVYASPHSKRVVFSVGTQARRLGLQPVMGVPMDHAIQLWGSAGVDVVVATAPGQAVRGEILDSEMLAPRALSSSAVVSYRHYEMSSDDPFGQRLVLVERSSMDELSGSLRKVVGARGMLGGELRGGIGYDWIRKVQQWRAGASVLLSATKTSRLTFDYDFASESATGIVGRRHAGSVVLHVDL
jgi:tetratricopeptide (TPR) repeat protein